MLAKLPEGEMEKSPNPDDVLPPVWDKEFGCSNPGGGGGGGLD